MRLDAWMKNESMEKKCGEEFGMMIFLFLFKLKENSEFEWEN